MNNKNDNLVLSSQPEAISDFFALDTTIKHEICKIHGEYGSRNIFRKVWSGCPTCLADMKVVEERLKVEEEAKQRKYIWKKKLGESCIPSRYEDRTLSSFITKDAGQQCALDFAKHYADHFVDVRACGRSAIFCGLVGTGKTHLAIGVGLQVMDQGYSVFFITFQRAVRRVKNTFNKKSEESESDVINLLTYPDLLIVDEIGIQYGSDFEHNLLFDIINERYEKRRPTLLISNLTPKEVRSTLGERIYDRLREDGGQCVPFSWESHRGAE
jgi:DNA replication protein DnaC